MANLFITSLILFIELSALAQVNARMLDVIDSVSIEPDSLKFEADNFNYKLICSDVVARYQKANSLMKLINKHGERFIERYYNDDNLLEAYNNVHDEKVLIESVLSMFPLQQDFQELTVKVLWSIPFGAPWYQINDFKITNFSINNMRYLYAYILSNKSMNIFVTRDENKLVAHYVTTWSKLCVDGLQSEIGAEYEDQKIIDFEYDVI